MFAEWQAQNNSCSWDVSDQLCSKNIKETIAGVFYEHAIEQHGPMQD